MLFTILALLLAPSSHAVDLPAHWCTTHGEPCSEKQVEIWDKFFASNTPLLSTSAPGLFTGECYFHSYYQDPARKAYGVAVFERKNDAVYYGGRFGEFFDSNPWSDLTLEQALSQGFVRFEDRFQLSFYADHTDASVSGSNEHFIYYWFRQSDSGQELYLLGQADGIVLNFCELHRQF